MGNLGLMIKHEFIVKKASSFLEDMQKLAQFALERYGRIGILVNNAGITPVSPLNELKVQEWDQIIDVNIIGVLYSIARAIVYAINEPDNIGVNEIVIRPTVLP